MGYICDKWLNQTHPVTSSPSELVVGDFQPPWNVNVIAYNLTNNIVATSYNNFKGLFSYPPANLANSGTTATTYTTTLSGLAYGNGNYIVTASLLRGAPAYIDAAFINTDTGVWWQVNPYPTSTTTTDNNSVVYTGEWVQIQLPSAIVINGYSQYNYVGNQVTQWAILGSTNGTTWILLDSKTYAITQNAPAVVFPVSTSIAYNYYRFVLIAGGTYPVAQGLQFYSNTKI